MTARAHIEIDRLVVESSAADGRELTRALRSELERLHASSAAATDGRGAGGRLELGDRAIEAAADASPGEIGRQVAQTIWAAAMDATRGETR